MRKTLLFLLTTLAIFDTIAQNTIGLLSYDPDKTQDGYLLLYPQNQGNCFLVNNCGEKVHVWNDGDHGPSNSVHLQPDGSLFMAKIHYTYTNSWIYGGGGGQKIEHRDWDNNLLWTYTYADSMKRMHHDFTVLPNGNVVLIAWERKFLPELLAAGKDTSFVTGNELWPDHLVEIQPIGLDSGAIVWEWHAWDHLIQDFDSLAANYGVVADHPELININYINGNNFADWMHVNSVDYNATRDQLIFSTPMLNEVWIIDHSTTSFESASHSGGLSGKGGDLIYRWGNPEAYQQGTSADRKLGFQHDIHWMDNDENPDSANLGRLMVFNNKSQPNISTANTFMPVFDTLTHQYQMVNNVYSPTGFDYSYTTPDPADMYCAVVSSVQQLPNGNKLICSGRLGYTLEVDELDEIVWEYKTPINNSVPATQGTIIPLSGNFTFRTKKFSSDWPGFIGRNLDAIGYIELNPDTTFCSTILSSTDQQLFDVVISPNPTNRIVSFSNIPANFNGSIHVYGLTGEQLFSQQLIGSALNELDLSNFQAGIYLLIVTSQQQGKTILRVVKN